MDCPHILEVRPEKEYQKGRSGQGGHGLITSRHHLQWLKENGITRYRWGWTTDVSELPGDGKKPPKWQRSSSATFNMGDDSEMLRFRFEDEKDKAHFALRWA